jgi:hypothetical protein
VAATTRTGRVGMASVWLTTGVVSASTESQLALKLAAHGAGASQWMIMHQGAPVSFTEVSSGSYTACVVPLPRQVSGPSGVAYMQRHGDKLAAFCQPVTVATDPGRQELSIAVFVPGFIPDGAGPIGRH